MNAFYKLIMKNIYYLHESEIKVINLTFGFVQNPVGKSVSDDSEFHILALDLSIMYLL